MVLHGLTQYFLQTSTVHMSTEVTPSFTPKQKHCVLFLQQVHHEGTSSQNAVLHSGLHHSGCEQHLLGNRTAELASIVNYNVCQCSSFVLIYIDMPICSASQAINILVDVFTLTLSKRDYLLHHIYVYKIAKSNCWVHNVFLSIHPSIHMYGTTRLPLDGFS
jgi:hypothetical protein